MTEFGQTLRIKDFYLDAKHANINHGSYGAVPKAVHEERMRLQLELERHPEQWFRVTSRRLWQESRQAAADFLGADVNNLVLVDNATTGVNAVIKSLSFGDGDSILIYSYTYKAVQNVCLSAIAKTGGSLVTVDLPLTLDSATIVRLYKEQLEKHPSIKLVLLDYISSCSAIRMPIAELIALCKEHNKLVLVDGAHAPGQVPLQLETLGAHFFTGNFHKWLYTPRGCAALWVHPDYHDVIEPVMTSHGYKTGSLQGDFFHQGTLDRSPFFSVNKAIEYYQTLGGMEAIQSYSTKLIQDAVAMLTKAWGTDRFPIAPELEAPCMRLIGLPAMRSYEPDNTNLFCDMTPLMERLRLDYDVTVVCLGIHGRCWVRISAQVYNSMADYERLRDAILDIISNE